MEKYIFSPSKALGGKDVKTAFLRIFALCEYQDMFSPTNFTNQWLENYIGLILRVKTSHVTQIRDTESLYPWEFLLDIL